MRVSARCGRKKGGRRSAGLAAAVARRAARRARVVRGRESVIMVD
jgi:hypothetical protein